MQTQQLLFWAFGSIAGPCWMKATTSLRVPVEVISRFCTLLIYICLHVPAVSGICRGKQQNTLKGAWAWGRADLGAAQLYHSWLSELGASVFVILNSTSKSGILIRVPTLGGCQED